MWGGVTRVRGINYDRREVGVLWIGDVPVSESKSVVWGNSRTCASAPSVRVGVANEESEPIVINELYRLVPSRCGNASRDVVAWAFG